jgi:hypothetical protein
MALTRPTTTQVANPNPIKNRIFVFAKSGLRILACVALAYHQVVVAAVLFATAEVISIVEELV